MAGGEQDAGYGGPQALGFALLAGQHRLGHVEGEDGKAGYRAVLTVGPEGEVAGAGRPSLMPAPFAPGVVGRTGFGRDYGRARGQKRMMAMPTKQTKPPMASKRSGRKPSKYQAHAMDMTMKTAPYTA